MPGSGDFEFNRIETFRFADDPSHDLTLSAVQNILLTSTSGNDTVEGFMVGETLDGGSGDDLLVGHDGDDTYIFGRGYGHDVIEDRVTSAFGYTGDRVLFKPGIDTADLEAARLEGDPGSMMLRIRGTADTLTLKNVNSDSNCEIELFEFADGTVWTGQNVRQLSLAQKTSGNDDVIEGFRKQDLLVGAGGNDSLYGGSGDDTVIGGTGNDFLQGQSGNDVYQFSRGDGQDTIYDNGYSNDIDELQLGPGISAADVGVSQSVNGQDLILTIAGGTDKITLQYQLLYDFGGVDRVRFADGTTWNRAVLVERSTLATAGNDIFYGDYNANTLSGQAGNDSLSGASGNDTLLGGTGNDTLTGGSNSDRFIFDVGFGFDTITDFKAGANTDDVIQFSSSIFSNFAAVKVASVQSGGNVVITASPDHTLTLRNVSLSSLHADDFAFA
jgi:Ca2+-binding RTX toxin-like protein